MAGRVDSRQGRYHPKGALHFSCVEGWFFLFCAYRRYRRKYLLRCSTGSASLFCHHQIILNYRSIVIFNLSSLTDRQDRRIPGHVDLLPPVTESQKR